MDFTQPRPHIVREPQQVCSATKCSKPIRSRELCNAHYLRWWKTASPEERRRPSKVQLFWAKVQRGPGCWEWQGARRPTGHGIFLGPEQKAISAARFSLELHLKQSIPTGTETCHRCDNPPCVNPRHLYFGTRQNNVDDAWARGLMPVGSQRPAAKLTEEQVVFIRHAYAVGAEAKSLAAQFGIAVPTLRHIVLGLKWKHAGGPITRRRPTRARKAA